LALGQKGGSPRNFDLKGFIKHASFHFFWCKNLGQRSGTFPHPTTLNAHGWLETIQKTLPLFIGEGKLYLPSFKFFG
jgi:hypothetical protein